MSEKWWDMSDDELDDLFREASDKVDVPFDSSAYNKLRQKIGEQPMSEPPKGFKKRWLFLLAGLFLMVGVGLVYRFGNDFKENILTENVDTENTVKPTLLSVSPKTIQKNDLKPLSVKTQTTKTEDLKPLSVKTQTTTTDSLLSARKEITKVEKSKLPISENKEGKTLLSVSSQVTKQENLKRLSVGTQTTKESGNLVKSSLEIQITAGTQTMAEEIAENKSTINDSKTYSLGQNGVLEGIFSNSRRAKNKLIIFNNSKNNKDREGKNYPLNPQISEQSPSTIIESLSNNLTENLPEETINRTNFYDVDFLKNKDSKSLLTDIRAELPEYVDSLPRTIKPVKFSTFGVRLMLSPDFNSIDNLGKMALGGSMGLLFEYKISRKLVVQTGIVYSSKSYVGSFDDYRNWKDWKGYHPSKPTQVDGGCKVFDIPINLRLNLFQKPKQTWFVSSGVSSYWMMNENYTYNYAWGSPRAVGWSDNSKYYFSVLNFSVGLERQISKRFSLQIEPYLKTPLKNVGRGGVNLYSSGLLFSTKYSF